MQPESLSINYVSNLDCLSSSIKKKGKEKGCGRMSQKMNNSTQDKISKEIDMALRTRDSVMLHTHTSPTALVSPSNTTPTPAHTPNTHSNGPANGTIG
jgi:hypothetical protein